MAFSSFNSLQSNWFKNNRNNANVVTPYMMLAGGGTYLTNSLASSIDGGTTWSLVQNTSTGDYFPFHLGTVWSFATNGTTIVCGGANGARGTMAYSTDGRNWIGLGISIISSICYFITYNPSGSRFVAVGTGNNAIAYSPDGINWTGLGTSIFTNGKCVACLGTNWLACGTAGTNWLASSPDGITWTALGKPSIMATTIQGIASNNNPDSPIWVAVGAGTNTIMYSTDSLPNINTIWTGVATNTLFSNGVGITYSVNTWIAAGNTINFIATSTNLINWTGKGTALPLASPNGITSNGANVVVVSGGAGSGIGNNILVSIDSGSTWLARGSTNPVTGTAIAGYGPGGGNMFGVAWIPQLSSFLIGSNVPNGSIRGKNQYIISSLPLPINTADLVGYARTIASGIGKHGTPAITSNGSTILISSDTLNSNVVSFDKGISWSVFTTWLPNLTMASGQSSWCSEFNTFITFPRANSVQDQSYYTSPTGETWTRVDSQTAGLGLNGTYSGSGFCSSDASGIILDSGATTIINTMVYISQGTSVISTSTNGTTWTGRGKLFGGLTFACIAVIWISNLNMFIATGTSGGIGYILKSPDNGATWTPSAFTISFTGPVIIDWSPQQQRLVIGGNANPFLIYSNDIGVTWIKCTISLPFTSVNSIKWNSSVNKWFACGSGGIGKSDNGITWTTVTQTVFGATTPVYNIQIIR